MTTGTIPVDPCARPTRCTVNAIVADPADCATFYLCIVSSRSVSGGSDKVQWARLTCDDNELFDVVQRRCLNSTATNVTCQLPCQALVSSTTSLGLASTKLSTKVQETSPEVSVSTSPLSPTSTAQILTTSQPSKLFLYYMRLFIVY